MGVKFVGLLDNPLVIFLISAFISAIVSLVINLLSQWVFTNWKTNRDSRIEFLEKRIRPLYTEVLEILERINTMTWHGWQYERSENLPIILADVKFELLDAHKQRRIK